MKAGLPPAAPRLLPGQRQDRVARPARLERAHALQVLAFEKEFRARHAVQRSAGQHRRAMHAACDALLGAAGEGDIGQQFPDTDPRFHGIYSIRLLESTLTIIGAKGFSVVNLDAVVFAEAPKLQPYRDEMQKILARAMGIDRQRIIDNFYPPGSVVASHFTPCSIPGGCDGPEWYEYNPEKAKEHFEKNIEITAGKFLLCLRAAKRGIFL